MGLSMLKRQQESRRTVKGWQPLALGNYRIALAGLSVWCSAASADVSIDQQGSLVASGPTQATYSAPYTFDGYGNSPNFLTVVPSATGNLATGTFSDGISFSGSLASACGGCDGDLAVYLPQLYISDSLTLSDTTGAAIPFTLSFSGTPKIVGPDINAVTEYFSVGGSINGGSDTACFSLSTGCGGEPVAGPNNALYTFVFSGIVPSGGQVTFGSFTGGYSQFQIGPAAETYVADSVSFDPLIQIVVPRGVTLTSESGVFPVTYVTAVPESSTITMMFVGLSLLVFTLRRASAARLRQPRRLRVLTMSPV